MAGERKRRACLALALLSPALGLAWLAHPVCVPLSDAELRQFTPRPVEQRDDRDLFLFRTFQQKHGQWCQCKSWLSRQLFFWRPLFEPAVS